MGFFIGKKAFFSKIEFLRLRLVELGGSSGIFWLCKLGLIVWTRFDTCYAVGTLLGHISDSQKRVLWVFSEPLLSKMEFSEAQDIYILVGSNGIFWLYKLRLIVLTRFDTWYVVGTLLSHIPHHWKLCVMGFQQGPKMTFFWHSGTCKTWKPRNQHE